jgi:hypothetical protein
MTGEREWVETVKASLQAELARKRLTVTTSHRLPYSLHVVAYNSKPGELAVGDPVTETHYQTDLLVTEQSEASGQWVPLGGRRIQVRKYNDPRRADLFS